jgi:transposase InsO family protein
MILGWLDESQAAGARLAPACHELSLDPRTIQRWRARSGGDDRRHGPKSQPRNKLTAAERQEVLDVANNREFRDLPPKQIVPRLADNDRYVASESTFYRVLREEKLNAHRGRAKAPTSQPPKEHRATGPNQVCSWDITYLRTPINGLFFYVDVWSRKIIGFRVEETENSELAAELLEELCAAEGLDPTCLVVHQDNGTPMKGATFKATMERLGVIPSFSRPRVSDDNPFSEALFRTMKYRPSYPRKPFTDLEAARDWVRVFTAWYNEEHLHSGIGFVTPADRHEGRVDPILERRRRVYADARRRNPERWSGPARPWTSPAEVVLNPAKETRIHATRHALAA